jgi:hypothetical protein
VTLLAIELGGEVADVPDLDVPGVDVGGLERAEDALAHHGREVLSLLRPVAGEVRLVAAEDVNFRVLRGGL